jgi:amino acid adenylation domain-containing protein
MDDRIEGSPTGEKSAPLSFAQQRLWLLDRLIPLGSVYNNPYVSCLTGELDPLVLESALNEVVRRHETLRTRFGMQDGEPVQVIAPALHIPLLVDDLSHRPPHEREGEAKRRATEDASLPFDLERGPLIRARLLRIAPSEHWLLIVWHHIVTDGWSSGVLTRELSTLYSAFRRGEPSQLPPLAVQYADFAQWQRKWLQGPMLEKLVRYWRTALSGLPTLELPTDRPHPTAASYRGERIELEIPEALVRSLKALSRRESVTLFMTLLAAWQVLLHRYSGQADIAVGIATAGRSRSELEAMIGFFVNTLVLRGDLQGNPSFREYLARVRSRALDAYTHQELPFEKLVEELGPKRDLARNPLFQASLAVNNTPMAQWKLDGLDAKRIDPVLRNTAKFDLALFLQEDGAGRMPGYLDYATDLFDAATAEQIARHFLSLLESIVPDAGCPIGMLPLLAPGERQRMLVEWNATVLPFPRDRCMHDLFEAAAATQPDAVAIECGETSITYGELDARADGIALDLVSLGVGPNVPVGICLGRSIDMVAALLGVLKAGGAYVPLDPRYPEERLRFILQDAGVPVLLTHRNLTDPLGLVGCRVVNLDRPMRSVSSDREPPRGAVAAVTAADLAYVIYTSGSTGTPKGVAIEHRSAVSFLHWVRSAFSDDDLSGVLGSTSISFDLSVFELFGALSWGGKVILVENALDLATCPRRDSVTLVNTVPSIMRTLIDTQELPESVRIVNLGGEALTEDLVDAIYERPHVRHVNDLYGPTETTIYSTWVRRAPSERPTIGRPIANTQIYLLDAYGNPVPPRVAGELYIGGEGVARGYLNRPELTAERFVPDPFSGRPGARLYRTGDFARYRHDGCLEFLGRADNQVKLRGFRIELSEIEAALSRHPNVREAAVIVREDKSGDKRLVAYVTARGRAPLGVDLKALVSRLLPYYMVPDAFVGLPALPTTPNGKLDRQALPIPEYEAGGADFEPPQTPLEIALAEIWAPLLGVPRVGRNDNFFELGGHSLLAAQLVGMINRSLGIDLSLRQLFQAPSVRELALAAVQRTAVADAS